jgi:hypothetical protein
MGTAHHQPPQPHAAPPAVYQRGLRRVPQVAIIVKGIESIRLLEKYSAPVLVALAAALLAWALTAAGGFGPMLSAPSQFAPGAAPVDDAARSARVLYAWGPAVLVLHRFVRGAALGNSKHCMRQHWRHHPCELPLPQAGQVGLAAEPCSHTARSSELVPGCVARNTFSPSPVARHLLVPPLDPRITFRDGPHCSRAIRGAVASSADLHLGAVAQSSATISKVRTADLKKRLNACSTIWLCPDAGLYLLSESKLPLPGVMCHAPVSSTY